MKLIIIFIGITIILFIGAFTLRFFSRQEFCQRLSNESKQEFKANWFSENDCSLK